MQRVTDQVDADYLEQPPPRPLPPVVALNLIGDYIFERPSSTFLDPLLLISVVTLAGMIALHANRLFWFAPVLLITARVIVGAYRIARRTWDDLLLLRKGLRLRAHVARSSSRRAAPTSAASGSPMASRPRGWRARGGSR